MCQQFIIDNEEKEMENHLPNMDNKTYVEREYSKSKHKKGVWGGKY